jgi:hypothetical protein
MLKVQSRRQSGPKRKGKTLYRQLSQRLSCIACQKTWPAIIRIAQKSILGHWYLCVMRIALSCIYFWHIMENWGKSIASWLSRSPYVGQYQQNEEIGSGDSRGQATSYFVGHPCGWQSYSLLGPQGAGIPARVLPVRFHLNDRIRLNLLGARTRPDLSAEKCLQSKS